MKNSLCTIVVMCTLVTACATDPDQLSATSISSLQYKDYSCDDISTESSRVEERTEELYKELKEKSETDNVQAAVGAILFWPALFFLEGGDGPEAEEYRQLKGEYKALEVVSEEMKCEIAFNDID